MMSRGLLGEQLGEAARSASAARDAVCDARVGRRFAFAEPVDARDGHARRERTLDMHAGGLREGGRREGARRLHVGDVDEADEARAVLFHGRTPRGAGGGSGGVDTSCLARNLNFNKINAAPHIGNAAKIWN